MNGPQLPVTEPAARCPGQATLGDSQTLTVGGSAFGERTLGGLGLSVIPVADPPLVSARVEFYNVQFVPRCRVLYPVSMNPISVETVRLRQQTRSAEASDIPLWTARLTSAECLDEIAASTRRAPRRHAKAYDTAWRCATCGNHASHLEGELFGLAKDGRHERRRRVERAQRSDSRTLNTRPIPTRLKRLPRSRRVLRC
jgi:hypothetical protein